MTRNKRGGELGVTKDREERSKISLAGVDFIAAFAQRRTKRYLHLRESTLYST